MNITETENIKLNNTIVTIGKFDCFHKGHQQLFKTAADMKTGDMELVMFMFNIHQNDLPDDKRKFIVSQQERRILAQDYGIDHCVEYPFTEDIRRMTPERFVQDILISKFGVRAVVAGDDFRFGVNRSGDVDTLKNLGKKYGFEVRIVERLKYKGKAICSSDIRDELVKGNMADVNAMLGRPYSLYGTVISGAHKGTGMGIPTINLEIPKDKLVPPFGVYASRVVTGNREMIAITNIGNRPTFYDNGITVAETFILDINEDLYGKNVKVQLFEHVRDEKKYETPDRLYEQIGKDIKTVRDYFSDKP